MGRPKGSKNKKKTESNVFYGYGRKVATKILNKLKFRKDKLNTNEKNTVKGQIEIIEVDAKNNEKGLTEKQLRGWIKNGKAKLIVRKKNMIVDTGLNWECDRFYQNSLDPMSYIAVGDDDTASTASDTALGSELTRVSASFTDTSNQTKATALFSAGVGTGNWKEAGLFNASSGGIMYNRVIFDYVKGAGVNTYVVFTITRSNA
jgi:hypothetical protein